MYGHNPTSAPLDVPCKDPRFLNRKDISGSVSVVCSKGAIEGDEIERADSLEWKPILDQEVEVEEVACLIAPARWVLRVECSFFFTSCGTQ